MATLARTTLPQTYIGALGALAFLATLGVTVEGPTAPNHLAFAAEAAPAWAASDPARKKILDQLAEQAATAVQALRHLDETARIVAAANLGAVLPAAVA